jgi:hypothetical protein
MRDNVDRRLLQHWEACHTRREEARRLLPREWADGGRPAADHLGDLFDDVLERARERIVTQRETLDQREMFSELDPAS